MNASPPTPPPGPESADSDSTDADSIGAGSTGAGSTQPQAIAQYRLDTVVASGGFGTVIRATDTTLDRVVAIKLIDDPERASGLIAEAKNTSRLSHSRIAQVYQAGVDEETGLAFIAFEWVEGPTLRAMLRREPLPISRFLRLGQDVAAAVAAAHEAELVHGDLKADNIVITGDPGRAKLLDFGLSIPDEEFGEGELWGTPAYMAPELLAGGTRTRETDHFALGVVLFEMGTGQLPFGGEDGDEHKVRGRQEKSAPDPREIRPEIPNEIAERIRSLLRRDPEKRSPDAVEVERVFRLRRRADEGKRLRLPPLIVVLLVVTLAFFFRDEIGLNPDQDSGTDGGATAVAPTVSVGAWVDGKGEETEGSRAVRNYLAMLLSGDDPGSGLFAASTETTVSGIVTVSSGIDGSPEWEAEWASPTGRGDRTESATSAFTLARLIADRVKNDNAGNRVAEFSEIPEEAIALFVEGVLASDRKNWAQAIAAFSEARDSAGAFPEAAAWEAALWVIEDRLENTRTLLSPLGDRPTAPAAILRGRLEIKVATPSLRWGAPHALARHLDLVFATHDPRVSDADLLAALEAEEGIAFPWAARTLAELAWRRGDLAGTRDAIERTRLLLGETPSSALWRLEHAVRLAGGDRKEAIEQFGDLLLDLPANHPVGWLRFPYLIQKRRIGPAANNAEGGPISGESALASALILAIAGRLEAAEERTRAIEDPFDPSLSARVIAGIEILAADAEAADRSLRRARELDPNRPETAILLQFIHEDPYEIAPEPDVPGDSRYGRFLEQLRALGIARAFRRDGDPASAERALAGLRFVDDDLTLFPWPEAVYLAWLERIASQWEQRGEVASKGEEAREEWRRFRRVWPIDRAPESRVGRLAAEVKTALDSRTGSQD